MLRTTCSGAPPLAEIFHNPNLAPVQRGNEKKISRPSGVQVSPLMPDLPKVRRFRAPPFKSSTQISALSTTLKRVKARVIPSGEKTGLPSPITPAGGKVSLRFSPVSRDNRKTLYGSEGELLSTTARDSPVGDQLKL